MDLLKSRGAKYDLMIMVVLLIQTGILLLGNNVYYLGVEGSSFSFLACGLLVGVLLLAKFRKQKVIVERSNTEGKNKSKFLIWLIAVIVMFCFLPQIAQSFIETPISLKYSDIIPTVVELCERFFKGEFVYKPIEKFGYYLPVTYLPAQWMPFLLAEKWGFDYRWITLSLFFLSFLLVAYRSQRHSLILQHFYILLLFLLSYLLIVFINPEIISISIELMIVAYYMALIVSMNINNPILRGIAIACCLMSRYSLVLWLPIGVLVLWQNESRKSVITTAMTVILLVIVFYVLPYLSKDWYIFYNGYKAYDGSALGEWTHIDYSTNMPYHLYNGFGFAHIVYQNFPGLSLEQKIKIAQRFHLWASFGTTLLLILYYLRNKGNIYYRIFLMVSFKLYIAIFLFFIQVPYLYLMLVDLFVGIAVFAEQFRYKIIGYLPVKQKV